MITKLIDKDKALEKLAYRKPYFGKDSSKERYRFMQWFADVNAIEELKPERAILIPEGATNGDIIEKTFDVKEIHAMIKTVFTVLKDGTELEFSREWYEAPFKREEE